MDHGDRTFCLMEAEDEVELAGLLCGHVWNLCRGFVHQGLLILNDSASEDQPARYAIVRMERDDDGLISGVQVDSFTFGGADPKAARQRLQEVREGRDFMSQPLTVRTEPHWHHTCELCRL
ncbi:MAG: hypothetical protein GKC10_08395 [Methanosarcinales archaeon]|nr:hypothetical protein [Methanosarcinales archaeon]